MHLSIASIIVLGYIIFAETQEQMQKRLQKAGEIYFIKNLPTPARFFVYFMNSSIAIFNAISLGGTDEIVMAALLLASTNIVLTVGKIVIDKEHVFIAHTKIKHENFKMLEIQQLSEKQGKIKFEMVVRKRTMKRELYLPVKKIEEMRSAMKAIYGNDFKPEHKVHHHPKKKGKGKK